MTDFYVYLFRKVVVLSELLVCEMTLFHLYLQICPFRPKQIVSTDKMINISKSQLY